VGATRDIADFAVRTQYKDLPPAVVHAAKRDIINVLAVGLYSARDPSLQILLSLFKEEGGNPHATVWGAGFKTTLANAALANGYTAHLEDYDDTHFPTVVHPTAPTLPAAFALAEECGASGRDLITAVALGVETVCRVSLSVHPWHYDAGWHITGTMGVFGSAIASSKILGLDLDQTVSAMGIAGTQAAGVREAFGTMSKAMHAGRAAQAGLNSALLAQKGFTSATEILEGRRGVAVVMSSDHDLSRLTDRLGERWEIFNNGLKPYSCGVVSHAAIDAAIALNARPGFDPTAVATIEAFVHPLVPELMGRMEPDVGLAGKFSCAHCISVGLVDGAAYPAQFADAKVKDPLLTALRRKVKFSIDDSKAEDQVTLRLTMKDGRVWEESIEHATGSPQNPMTDERLTGKFLTLVSPTLGDAAAKSLLDRLWHLDEVTDIRTIPITGDATGAAFSGGSGSVPRPLEHL
jgi:2-methylcitrate dehydratase PrpD